MPPPGENPFAGPDKPPAAEPPARLVCPFMGTMGQPQVEHGIARADKPTIKLVPVNMYCQEEGCMFWYVPAGGKGACTLKAAAVKYLGAEAG